MAPNKQTGGVQSRPECAHSKQLAKTPDLLAFAFAHVRNQSCRLTQHIGSSPINKTRLIGHLQLTG